MLVSLELSGCRVVVVGSSDHAMERSAALSREGAVVTMVTNSRSNRNVPCSDGYAIVWRKLRGSDLRNAFLVVATDRDKALNKWLYATSKKRHFLLNTLDEKETCNFYHTSVRNVHASLELAVSTGGASPAFASRISDRLAALIEDEDIAVLEGFIAARDELRKRGLSTFDFDWSALEARIRESFVVHRPQSETSSWRGSGHSGDSNVDPERVRAERPDSGFAQVLSPARISSSTRELNLDE